MCLHGCFLQVDRLIGRMKGICLSERVAADRQVCSNAIAPHQIIFDSVSHGRYHLCWVLDVVQSSQLSLADRSAVLGVCERFLSGECHTDGA